MLEFLRQSKAKLITRGNGRCYGDAAQSESGIVVSTNRLPKLLELSSNAAAATCSAAVTFADLIQAAVKNQHLPSVIPGTKYVTMGGAVSADVHGKNHYLEGSFAECVSSFTLVDARGERLNCSRQENEEVFWACFGSMGLLGIVSDVKIRLSKLSSQGVLTTQTITSDLSDTFAKLTDASRRSKYCVVWIDGTASGKQFGRGVVISGDHCQASFAINDFAESLASQKFRLNFDTPDFLLNEYSIRLFNEFYFKAAQRKSGSQAVLDLERFFFPLDVIEDWNRLYGRRGFIQYQFAVPDEHAFEATETVLRILQDRKYYSCLTVLKKLGAKQHGYLSFPCQGYTLCLDIPASKRITELTSELDKVVIKFGGRIYLAKDSTLTAQSFRKMYPDYAKWLGIKRSVDPRNKFSSQLSERLKLNQI